MIGGLNVMCSGMRVRGRDICPLFKLAKNIMGARASSALPPPYGKGVCSIMDTISYRKRWLLSTYTLFVKDSSRPLETLCWQ